MNTTLQPLNNLSQSKYSFVSNTNKVHPSPLDGDSTNLEIFSPLAEAVTPRLKGSAIKTKTLSTMKVKINEFTEQALKNLQGNEEGEDYVKSLTVVDLTPEYNPMAGMISRIGVFNFYLIIFFFNLLSVLGAIFTNEYRIRGLDQSYEGPLKILELIVAFFFGFEIFFNIFNQKRSFYKYMIQMFTLYNLGNLLLIMEIVTTVLYSVDFQRVNSIFALIYILRSFKLQKVQKILHLIFKHLREIMKNDNQPDVDAMKEQSEIRNFVFDSSIEIGIGIFIEASFLMALNEVLNYQGYGHTDSNGNADVITLDYIAAMYYVTVSMTSIGYGDIYPMTCLTRVSTVCMIFFDISELSKYIGEMTEHIYKLSPYIRNIHFTNHIVVIGDLPLSFLKYFLDELYQCDLLTSTVYQKVEDISKKAQISKMIVVGKDDPNELGSWLENFSDKCTEIKYLKANVFENVWHKQTNLQKARHLFVFSMNPNETPTQKFESDKKMSYNVQKVINDFPTLEITLILSSDFSKQIKKDSLWSKINVISSESINECIMANSLENQGLNIWLTHLSTLREKKGPNVDKEFKDLQDYSLNMSQEIYPISNFNDFVKYFLISFIISIEMPQYFVGKTFKEAVISTYFSSFDISENYSYDYSKNQAPNLSPRSGLLLIGIEYKNSTILINPSNYEIKKDDIGLVVAFDLENARKLTEFAEKSQEHSIYLKNMNYFKKANMDERDKLLDKMAEHMEDRLKKWNIKKEKFYSKKGKRPPEIRFENLEIPLIYNLFEKQSPKGIFENHIIIKGTFDRFERVALVLRSYSDRPILLFSDEKPNPGELMKVQDVLKNIFYVYGCTNRVKHIVQLDPKKAFKILILSSAKNNFLMDSESIVFTRIISDFFGLNNFLTEMMEEHNMKYISYNPKWDNNNYFCWPLFARGSIHFSSLSMSIIAKSINNKKWSSFIRDLTNPISSQFTSKIESFEQNSKINSLLVNKQVVTEFEYFGQLQYFLMNNNPTVIAIGLLKTGSKIEENVKTEKSQALKRMETMSPALKKTGNMKQLKKMLENFYGSEFLMTNPSALMPLKEGDTILVIGNIRKSSDGLVNKIVGSSFRLATPSSRQKSPMNKSPNSQKHNGMFDFGSELELNNVKVYQKKSIGLIKEKIEEMLGKFNKLMKEIIGQ